MPGRFFFVCLFGRVICDCFKNDEIAFLFIYSISL